MKNGHPCTKADSGSVTSRSCTGHSSPLTARFLLAFSRRSPFYTNIRPRSSRHMPAIIVTTTGLPLDVPCPSKEGVTPKHISLEPVFLHKHHTQSRSARILCEPYTAVHF